MNSHLEPVFKILLPSLEDAGLDYWVYGGVGIAVVAGKFIRNNRDVDIFVKEKDYGQAMIILDGVCNNQDNFCAIPRNTLNKGNYLRPKLDIKINKKEIFSMVPIFLKSATATLVFGNGPQAFSLDILKIVKRSLSGYTFFTPTDQSIKEIFIKSLDSKRNNKKVLKDAFAILTCSEVERLI